VAAACGARRPVNAPVNGPRREAAAGDPDHDRIKSIGS
jgi:hypothetical protein